MQHQSNGHIKIDSEPGEGTTVKIYLPRFIGARMDVEPGDDPVDATPDMGSETILAVEDDPMVRSYAAEILNDVGYRVLEAESGAHTLPFIEKNPDIDLLFTDIVMPGGLNGHQLTDAALLVRPELKVLYTTGYTRNAIVHHGRLDPDVNLGRCSMNKRLARSRISGGLRRGSTRSRPLSKTQPRYDLSVSKRWRKPKRRSI